MLKPQLNPLDKYIISITRCDDRYATAVFAESRVWDRVPLFWKYENFLITHCTRDRRRPPCQNPARSCLAVSAKRRLVIQAPGDSKCRASGASRRAGNEAAGDVTPTGG